MQEIGGWAGRGWCSWPLGSALGGKTASVPSQWFASQIRASVGAPKARTRGSAGFGTPWLNTTRIPQQVPAHGATRPHPASALGTRAAAPEQGRAVLDGPQGSEGWPRRRPTCRTNFRDGTLAGAGAIRGWTHMLGSIAEPPSHLATFFSPI
jgi:hypothetical protein